MNTDMNRAMRRACTGLLCVAALGLVASLPAGAQSRRTRPTTGSAAKPAPSSMSNTKMADDDQYSDPMPVGYPQAAPGTIDLYHFHTYRGNRLMQGSVQDMRDQNMRMKQQQMMMGDSRGMSMRDAMKTAYRDNPFMADPAPVNYPVAAPGSLELYSYSDYTGNMITPGSVTDKRMDKAMMRDQMMMSKGPMHFDRAMMPDPFPINYPFAAPGSLDLYSFSDYTGDKLVPGSASDRKADKDRMMDQQTMKGGKSTRKPKSK